MDTSTVGLLSGTGLIAGAGVAGLGAIKSQNQSAGLTAAEIAGGLGLAAAGVYGFTTMPKTPTPAAGDTVGKGAQTSGTIPPPGSQVAGRETPEGGNGLDPAANDIQAAKGGHPEADLIDLSDPIAKQPELPPKPSGSTVQQSTNQHPEKDLVDFAESNAEQPVQTTKPPKLTGEQLANQHIENNLAEFASTKTPVQAAAQASESRSESVPSSPKASESVRSSSTEIPDDWEKFDSPEAEHATTSAPTQPIRQAAEASRPNVHGNSGAGHRVEREDNRDADALKMLRSTVLPFVGTKVPLSTAVQLQKALGNAEKAAAANDTELAAKYMGEIHSLIPRSLGPEIQARMNAADSGDHSLPTQPVRQAAEASKPSVHGNSEASWESGYDSDSSGFSEYSRVSDESVDSHGTRPAQAQSTKPHVAAPHLEVLK